MEEGNINKTKKYSPEEGKSSKDSRKFSKQYMFPHYMDNKSSSMPLKKDKTSWWKRVLEKWETTDMAVDQDFNTEMRIMFRELITYTFFLLVVLISAFGLTSKTRFYYSKAMEDLFVNNAYSSSGSTFKDLTIISDFWSFANTVLINGLFWNYWYRTKDEHKETGEDDNKILYENKLLGLPRIRQVRVRPNSCIIREDFRRSFATCYAPYSSEAEDKTPFGPSIGTAWNYNSEEEVNAIRFWGQVATYGGGGYYTDLPVSSKEDMILALAILKDNIWIRRGTRAVFIDFTVYNANVNLFCIVQLVIELPATGGVIPSWKFNSVKLLRYVSVFDFFVLGCEFVVIIFVIFFILEEITEMIHYKLKYFRNRWNIFDLLVIVIALVCIGISIYRTVETNIKIHRLIDYTNEYPNFEQLGYWETQYNNTIAVFVFFVWIKVFKYIKFNKTMNQLAQTLRRCSKDILGFSVMFFIVFMAYAQLGHLIFGDQLEAFNNIVRSSFTLLRAILGDFDYDSIQAVDRIAGPIFFLSFIFLVFFILLNVFLAIISDTYSEVKAETESINIFDMGKYCCRGFRNLLIKMKILKKKKPEEIKVKKLTGRRIREMLTKHNFTDLEVDAFLGKYGIEDEELVIDEETAQRMLRGMEGKTNDEILNELTAPDAEFSVAEFDKLKKRVDAIETSFEELTPKVDALTRIIEEIFED